MQYAVQMVFRACVRVHTSTEDLSKIAGNSIALLAEMKELGPYGAQPSAYCVEYEQIMGTHSLYFSCAWKNEPAFRIGTVHTYSYIHVYTRGVNRAGPNAGRAWPGRTILIP